MWKEIEIPNWESFIHLMDKTNGVYWKPSMWSFRGQPNYNWELTSSLTRKLRLANVSDIETVRNIEQAMLSEFIQKYPVYSKSENIQMNYDLLRWLTIMQHFGCPTRLLDWTDSPYVALYFACITDRDSNGAVFCFNDSVFLRESDKDYDNMKSYTEKDLLWRGDSNKVFHMVTHFQNTRCMSQKGTFTFSMNPFESHDNEICRLLSNKTTDERRSLALKLIVPKQLKLDFLMKLNSFNINGETLFPGIEGFAKSLGEMVDMKIYEREFFEKNLGLKFIREVDKTIFKKSE